MMGSGPYRFTFDTAVLVAADRNDPRAWSLLDSSNESGRRPIVPAVCVVEAWRSPRQANLARFLAGCKVAGHDEDAARRAGVLLGRAETVDPVDALVVDAAAQRHDTVVTGDVADLERLSAALPRPIRVRAL